MSDGDPAPQRRPEPPEASTGDDEYARAYSEGFGEGLREALRELLQHASRGHTAQEMRFLVESRLARVGEEVERKRRSLLAPPRKPAWGALLRAPETAPAAGRPTPAPEAVVAPGRSRLVLEERPTQALALLEHSAPAFAQVILVSERPPSVAAAQGRPALILRVGGASGDPTRPGLAPGEMAGRIRESIDGGAVPLVYLDAFDALSTEYSSETSLRFVGWVADRASEGKAALIVSVDPRTLDPKELGRLERAFNTPG